MSNQLTHLSLFSGIGGLDLAAEWAGFKTVGQCEWAEYPTKVLEKHWPDAPRWKDIRTLTGSDFFERTGLHTVDVISGGFPCQPFSVAGKRRGKEDDRYLWPEMLRVISELRPTWVVGENVAGIVSMALDQVYTDLENEGYTVQAFIIPACAVDAPHRRDRCAIVAWNSNGRDRDAWAEREVEKRENAEPTGICENVAHVESIGLQREWSGGDQIGGTRPEKAQPERRCDVLSDTDNRSRSLRGNWELPAVEETQGQRTNHGGRAPEYVTGERWPVKPGLGGVVDGVPPWMDRYWVEEPKIPRITTDKKNRVDRLKCLGNAVYWRQFYPIFRAIKETEEMLCDFSD